MTTSPVTIGFVYKATRASLEAGRPDWSMRIVAYHRAYRRRLMREMRANGEHGEASPALMCLSSRLMDVCA